MTPRLAPLSDEQRARVRERLARTGRAQINDVLEKVDAQALHAAAATSEYNIVTRRGTGHVDLPAAWLASLQPHKKQALGQAIQTAAREDFQYLYDNHPIYDLAQAGRAAPVWRDLLSFLNGDAFLRLMRELTGEPRIALADAQLTRYRPGHFLTEHDDHAEGKNRFFAYVLNLTPSLAHRMGRTAGLPRRGRQCGRGLHPAIQHPEPVEGARAAFRHPGGAVGGRRSAFGHGLAARRLISSPRTPPAGPPRARPGCRQSG